LGLFGAAQMTSTGLLVEAVDVSLVALGWN